MMVEQRTGAEGRGIDGEGDVAKSREELLAELSALRARVAQQERDLRLLRDSERQLHVVADQIPAHLAYVGARDLQYKWVNARFPSSFAVPREQIVGHHIESLIGAANYQFARPFIERVRAGESVSYANDFWLAQGRRRIRVDYVPDVREGGEVVGIVVMSQDITAVTEMEEALRGRVRELECLYRVSALLEVPGLTLSQVLEQMVVLLPPVCYFADIAESRIELDGTTHQTVGFRETQWVLAHDIAIGNERVGRVELCYREELPAGPEGPFRPEEVTLLGAVAERLGQHLRRTRAEAEQWDLQARLLQAQKMEAVGQLAGGVAHDFNNILAAMTMQLDLLRLEPEVRRGELLHALDLVLGLAGRAANLTRQLLLFGRRQAMRNARHEANSLVVQLVRMLERLLGDHIELRVDCGEAPLWFEGDAGMIDQVLTNLAVNARDAMPRGGRLTVVTRRVVIDAGASTRHPSARPGDFVCIEVSDTGTGMAPGVLERLFEPFFTTKPAGKGTGLGLATVEGIIAKHRGWVEVASKLGVGSTFRVYLPRELEPGGVLPPPVLVSPGAGDERILLVEDEASVREIMAACLRRLGYRVTEATDGVEAAKLWAAHQGDYELLLTDMVMPGGVTGLELCHQLKAQRPALKLIIASGYSAELVHEAQTPLADLTFLPKPFDVGTLTAAVRKALDGTSAE